LSPPAPHPTCLAAFVCARFAPTLLACLLVAAAPAAAHGQLAYGDDARPTTVLDDALAEADTQLARVQRNTRLYLGSWLAANVALSGAQLAVALTATRDETRGNYFVGTGLSVAGMGVLLTQKWPALRALKKFRAMPRGTEQEKVAAIGYAETAMAHQRSWDRLAVRPDHHIAAGVLAVAAGLGVGLGFDSLKEGLSRGLGVFFILELQIATRPGAFLGPVDRGRSDRPYLTFGPWLDRHAQGASVRGVF
jgi:hypothetical protein